MDNAAIQKLADAIAARLPNYSLAIIAIQIVLIVFAAGVGAFIGEYLRTRGKNLATKADFDSLKDQLRTNTELVETVKAEVGREDWAKREWTNLRRVKLEELFKIMNECESYRHRFDQMVNKRDLLDEQDPGDQLDTIVSLYFPELKREGDDYKRAHNELVGFSQELLHQLLLEDDDEARGKLFQQRITEKPYLPYILARQHLTLAAHKLLREMMGQPVSLHEEVLLRVYQGDFIEKDSQ